MSINKKAMSKLLTILNGLKDVMVEAKKHDKPLDMADFYEDDELVELTGETIHDCNTPACVLGYAAIHPPFMDIIDEGDITSPGELEVWLEEMDSPHDSNALSIDITSLCTSLFGADYDKRRDNARRCGLFNKAESTTYTHLMSDVPTPQDVIDYINGIISKLNGLKA